MSTRALRDARGYTLVEFAVAMSVFMIFMAIAAPFMFSQLRGALATQDRVERTQNARTALRLMTRELRQTAYLINDPPAKPVGPIEISFAVDFNGDGMINPHDDANLPLEEITYHYNGGQDVLYRGRNAGQGAPLASEVTAVDFEYFGSNLALDLNDDGIVSEAELDPDGNGLQPSELAHVTRVAITLTVGDEQTYRAQALLRNRVS
jgi:type II secretory pathway component PulJ